VRRRSALAGSVTTATVLPVVSKKLDRVAFLWNTGQAVLLHDRYDIASAERSVTSRARITSPYMSKAFLAGAFAWLSATPWRGAVRPPRQCEADHQAGHWFARRVPS
jgi:hypothetical protein